MTNSIVNGLTRRRKRHRTMFA